MTVLNSTNSFYSNYAKCIKYKSILICIIFVYSISSFLFSQKLYAQESIDLYEQEWNYSFQKTTSTSRNKNNAKTNKSINLPRRFSSAFFMTRSKASNKIQNKTSGDIWISTLFSYENSKSRTKSNESILFISSFCGELDVYLNDRKLSPTKNQLPQAKACPMQGIYILQGCLVQ